MATAPPIQELPAPWRVLPVFGVGGLIQVGYATGTDLLLVLSGNGRGVFDCLTGEKVARDYDEAHDFFDPIRLTAEGLGPLAGQTVRVAGLFGGGLPRSTHDGWFLEPQARAWPKHSIFLTAPKSKTPVCIGDDGACVLQACGFSETGRSFIIATSCDLRMFMRPASPLAPGVSS